MADSNILTDYEIQDSDLSPRLAAFLTVCSGSWQVPVARVASPTQTPDRIDRLLLGGGHYLAPVSQPLPSPITVPPAELGRLSALSALDISGNPLPYLPPEVGQLAESSGAPGVCGISAGVRRT